MNDDDVLQLLRSALPPVPSFVREAAARAWAWRDPDASLAELIMDSAAAAGLRRSGGHERMRVYALAGLEVTVTVVHGGGMHEVGVCAEPADGSLPGATVQFSVDVVDGPLRRTQHFTDVPAGDTVTMLVQDGRMVRVIADTGAIRVATPWLLVGDTETETGGTETERGDGDGGQVIDLSVR